MKKLVLLSGVLVLFSLTLAGCGGSNSGGNNHTHASMEGVEDQINKFLGDVSEYRVDEILNDHFLDSKSFTLQFLDEDGNVDKSKTKVYSVLASELIEEQKDWETKNYDLKVELRDSTKDTSGFKDIAITGTLDTNGYCEIEYAVHVIITESPSVPRDGLMAITMRNYDNQSQWLCSEIMMPKVLYKDNKKAFGFRTYAGSN